MVVPRLCLTMPTVERNVVVDQPSTSARPLFERQMMLYLLLPGHTPAFLMAILICSVSTQKRPPPSPLHS